MSNGCELHFVFPQDQLQYAADTEAGKLRHAMDIKENQQRRAEIRQSKKFKERQQRYKSMLLLKPECEEV